MSTSVLATISASAPVGPRSNQPPPEEMFVTNMLLLGFDREAAEKRYGVALKSDMFHGCNVKGMEVVFHFLFLKISPDAAKDALRVIWPITDKKQSRDFKTFANKFITDLEKAGHIPNGTFRLSHLHTCSGDRFYYLCWQLSIYAMKCTLSRSGVSVPHFPALDSSTLQHFESIRDAIRLRRTRAANQFVARANEMAQEQQQWFQMAQSLQAEYRELTQRKAALEKESKEFDALVASAAQNQTVAFTAEQLATAESAWNQHLAFLESQQTKKGMQMIENIFEKRSNAIALDAKKPELRLDPHTVDMVSQMLSSEGRNAYQPYVDGKLDLDNLTQLWTESVSGVIKPKLDELREAVKDRDMDSASGDYLEDTIKKLKLSEEQMLHHGAAARKTASIISQTIIPEMKENIARLQQSADERPRQFVRPVPLTPSTVGLTPKKAWTQAEKEQRNRERMLDLVPPTPAVSTVQSRIALTTTAKKRGEELPIIPSEPFSLLPAAFKEIPMTLAPDQAVVSKMSSEIRAAVSSLSRKNLLRASPASANSRKQKRINAAAALAAAATPSSKLPTKDSLAAFGLSPLQVDTFDVEDIMRDLPAMPATITKTKPAAQQQTKPASTSVDLSSYISTKQQQSKQISSKQAAPAASSQMIQVRTKPPSKTTAPAKTTATTASTTTVPKNDKKPSKRDNLPEKPWVLARQAREAEAAAAKAQAAAEAERAKSKKTSAGAKKVAAEPPQKRKADPDVEKAFRIMTEAEPAPVDALNTTVNYTMVEEDDVGAFRTRKQITRTPEVKSSRGSLASADDADELHQLEQTVANITVAAFDDGEDADYERMLDELDHDSVRDGRSRRLTVAASVHASSESQEVDTSALEASIREDDEESIERSVEEKFSKAVNAFSRAPTASMRYRSPAKGFGAMDGELSMYEAELDMLDSPARPSSRQDENHELEADELNESTQSSIEMATAVDVPISDVQLASPASPSAGRWTMLQQQPRLSESPVSIRTQHVNAADVEDVTESHQSVSLLDDSFVVPVGDEEAEEKDYDLSNDLLNGSISLDTHLSGNPNDLTNDDDDTDLVGRHSSQGLRKEESEPHHDPQLDMSISLDDVADQADSDDLAIANLASPVMNFGGFPNSDSLNDSLSMPSPTLHRITKHLEFSPKIDGASALSFGSPL